MSSMSPGVAGSSIYLLKYLSVRPHSQDELLRLNRIGVVANERALEFCRDLFLIEIDTQSNCLVMAEKGQSIVDASAHYLAMRRLIEIYAQVQRPAWASLAPSGRAQVLRFCPPEVRQIFDEADLIENNAEDAIEFWDRLASGVRGVKDARYTEIGRKGERLTLQHERNRVNREPRWIAIDDNSAGYDVLSVTEAGLSQRLLIEVKATTQENGYIYFTRNEWETAETAAAYVLHIWRLADNRLAVISSDDLSCHIPSDHGDGSWKEVKISLNAFEAAFDTPFQT